MTRTQRAMALTLASALAHCAAHTQTQQITQTTRRDRREDRGPGGDTHAARTRVTAARMDPALESLRASLEQSAPEALARVGLVLGRGGATELDGSAAPDERVRLALTVVQDAQSAALVVRTTCGNAQIIGMVQSPSGWTQRGRVVLVPAVGPGQCVRTTLVAQPVALRSDPARELAVGVRWEDTTGDEVQGPNLWVAALDPREGVRLLLERAPFGETNDQSGASTEGSLAVVDELPAPRPLFVEIRPGRRGVAGSAARERLLRRYELRGERLELVDERREALQVVTPSEASAGHVE
ncbi:MAG: hypothetical protein Q8Q09_24780 [Deltaproteobacteria bacterium]|nr:hypothetical protein [Deltaproteobacteria bacterium]